MYHDRRLRSLRSLRASRIAVHVLVRLLLLVWLRLRRQCSQVILAWLCIAKDAGRLLGYGQRIDRFSDRARIEHNLGAIVVIEEGFAGCTRSAPRRVLGTLALGIIVSTAIFCIILPEVGVASAVIADAALSLPSAATKVVALVESTDRRGKVSGGLG